MQTAQENPSLDLQPSQTLDCRGMLCPAPILELSKAARTYGKQATVLEIIVDDAEFPSDLRAWCRASKNTLLNLMEDDGLFVAHVGLNIRGEEKGPASGPRTIATSQKAPALLTPNGVPHGAPMASGPTAEYQTHTIDCRGMLCPAPILAVAKKAQQLGRQGSLMEILATDEQFPTDLKAWCRASKAQLVKAEQVAGEIRALVVIGSVPQEVIEQAMPAPAEELSVPLVNVKVPPAPAAPHAAADAACKPTVPDFPRPQAAASPPPEALRRREPKIVTPPPPALTAPRPAAPPVAVNPAPPASAKGNVASTDTSASPVPVALRSSPTVAEAKSAPTMGMLTAVAPANDVTAQLLPRENRCTISVNKNDIESLVAAVTYASAASAQGMEATIFLSFAAVNLLRSDRLRANSIEEGVGFLPRMPPKDSARQEPSKVQLAGQDEGSVQLFLRNNNVGGLDELLASTTARKVKFIVCATSLVVLGLQKREIVQLPNVEFAEVANFVELSRRSAMNLVF